MSLAQAPPRKRATSSSVAPRKTQADKRTEAVQGLFDLGSFGCIMMGQYADAAAIGMHGPNISGEVAKLAAADERIAAWIDRLTQVGPYAGLIGATLPLILQVLANHKRLPADKMPSQLGIIPPEALEAKAQAQAMQVAAAIQQEAQQAMDEAERTMADIAASQERTEPPGGNAA
jgi:hypothetical protein